jgi:hypothetical protein
MFEAYGHDLRESVRCRTQMRETRALLAPRGRSLQWPWFTFWKWALIFAIHLIAILGFLLKRISSPAKSPYGV